ncbi:hypothetical protein G5V59_18950 [Nocardioides sp. W3-2-3]|uniref:hypothetical protein n=1 Tax=Nocardioides convexus TaxID=2712224 RepID=UPI00241824A5|nr:hypothetical protein [Nocardioides convexus]NHA01231.1 hypothetical protein [Nocardioides convexus]
MAGRRTEVGDDVGRRERDVRQSGDGRHRRGGPSPQDVVDRFSVAARARLADQDERTFASAATTRKAPPR